MALDPDASVRDQVRLVFDRFLAPGSVQKVLRAVRDRMRRQQAIRGGRSVLTARAAG